MPDASGAFFEALARRGHVPALRRASGTVGIEITNGRGRRRWLVHIDKGDVSVSNKAGPADCTMRASEDVFRAIAAGRTSPTAAVLRGAVAIEGDLSLLVLFRRLLPGPPGKGRRSRR